MLKLLFGCDEIAFVVLIATGSWDKTVRLWDLKGNPMGEPLRGPKGWVSSLVFSRDGKFIISSGADKTVRSHRGGNWQDWLKVACNQLHDHPILQNPQTKEAKGAKDTCQKYVWNRR